MVQFQSELYHFSFQNDKIFNMNATEIIIAFLTLLAGIGVFLMACQMMSSHLESVSSKRLKRLFSRTGKNKWIGVGIGTIGTAAIQSSGAVTVMVIGFVNVGIMSLAQAATIIYGANIGTTVTAQLVALGMTGSGGVSPTVIFASMAGIGAFLALFSKRDMLKQVGGILAGFGLLFVGLAMMADAMDGFAALEGVKLFLASIDNPLLLVFIGTVMTAVIQSSSVMTSITITMVVSGLVLLDQGIYLTMGSNIGSCVVALIAGLTSGVNAKRTAIIHLIFNIMGVVIFLVMALILWLASGGSWSFGRLFGLLFKGEPQLQLAMFHTVFNVCTMLVALPLTNLLVSFSCKLIKDKKSDTNNEPHFYFLDYQMLRTPVVAVRQVKAEIENMSQIAMQNFHRAIKIVTTMDYSELEKFKKTEHELNYLNAELVRFTVQLFDKRLNRFDHQYLTTSVRSVCDLERIGDYAENIVEYADALKQQGSSFSPDAIKEILQMEKLIDNLYSEIMQAYHKLDIEALERAYVVEDKIDDFTEIMEQSHIERLGRGECDPTTGAEYISLAQNAERVADHLINVGNTIRDLVKVNQ